MEMMFFSMTVFTLGEMISIPVSSTYVASLAPLNMRGRYMGLTGLSWSAASMIGPALGMRIFAWHPTILWLLCGVLGMYGGAIILARGSTSPQTVSEEGGTAGGALIGAREET